MLRMVICFLGLAVLLGAVLFAAPQARWGGILDVAFIASVGGFLASLVVLMVKRAGESLDGPNQGQAGGARKRRRDGRARRAH